MIYVIAVWNMYRERLLNILGCALVVVDVNLCRVGSMHVAARLERYSTVCVPYDEA